MAGVGGMLGYYLYGVFRKDYWLKCTDKDVNEEWLTELDFTSYTDYQLDVMEFDHPDYLFHIGALTDLEYCETHVDEAYITNILGVENAVHIANKYDIPIIYISTAGIFNGHDNLYDDWATPNPRNVYGFTKYMGEKYVLMNAKKYYVFRAGWMMGGYHKDKKFVRKILNQIESGNTEIKAVTDKWGSPTYAYDFACNMKEVVERDLPYGVYNMSGEGMVNRYHVAKEMVKILELENTVVIPATSEAFPSYYATRPMNESLRNRKLGLLGINRMRPWQEALKHYLCSQITWG